MKNDYELKSDEQANLEKLRAISAHIETKTAEEAVFQRRDKEAIPLAHQLRGELDAGSPNAPNTAALLAVKRNERDGARFAWNRQLEKLTFEAEKDTLPLILEHGANVQLWCRLILRQRDFAFVRHATNEPEGGTNLVKTNVKAIAAAINDQMHDLADIKKMSLAPLHELRARIRKAHANFDTLIARGFPCTEEVVAGRGQLDEFRYVEVPDPTPARVEFHSLFSN